MKLKNKKFLIIYPTNTIIEALRLINSNGHRSLVVCKKNLKFLGTLTDGDLRNIILKKKNLNFKIQNIFNKKSVFFIENQYEYRDLKKAFLENNLSIIPIINKKKYLIEIISWFEIFSEQKKNFLEKNKRKINRKIDVVISAGGKGERLLPLTSIIPKPLIPYKEKPMIKHVIDGFTLQGFLNFKITTNYKSDILRAYLKEIKNKEIKIDEINEKTPLGTAGGLKLIKKISRLFFFIPCDTLINLKYDEVINFHIQRKLDITIVSCIKRFTFPYGVCNYEKNGILKKINEKPNIDMMVNTGLVLLNKKILQLISKNSINEFDDILNKAIKKNYKIGIFPLLESQWIDLGSKNSLI